MARRIVQFFVERSLLVNIITVGVLLAGIMFLMTAQREAFPRVAYNYVVITTIYPGAAAEDVEKHLTVPIEDQLREVEGIEELFSFSLESRSVVVIKLDPDLQDNDRAVTDIRDAIDLVTDFPEDAEDPIVRELTTSLLPVIEISVVRKRGVSNDDDERQLRWHARALQDILMELPGVAKIDRQGYRDREMIVEVDPVLLHDYHIGLNEIIRALNLRNLNFPGGTVRVNGEEVMLRTIGEVDTAPQIAGVLVRANDMGNWVHLRDVASVKDSFRERDIIINRTNGERSVTLTVLKKESADIIELVDDIIAQIGRFRSQYGADYDVIISQDMSYFVRRRLSVLIGNAIIGFILVFGVLLITLGWRISLVTAMGIPLAFAGTFVWMGQYGITINLMSMFGMIMVLGMLVDDAIVVAENVYSYLEEGLPIKEAVLRGTSEVISPVAGTILTTIAAFFPLMSMGGIMGKFMWTLPAVVCVALIASWIESMFILPSHIHDLEERRKSKVHEAVNRETGLYLRVRARYAGILRLVLSHKYKFAGLIAVFFVGTLLFAVSNVKFVLFPSGKIERFVVKAEAPTGTSLEDMNTKMIGVEKLLSGLPKTELDSYLTLVGIRRTQPMDPEEKRGSNLATVIVNLRPEENRKRKVSEIIEDMRRKSEAIKHQFVKIEFGYTKEGPPSGKPVNVAVKGDDFSVLEKVSAEVKSYLLSIKGLKDIKDDHEAGKKEVRIHIDEKRASIAGISVFDIASTIRTCYEGTIATRIKKSEEEIEIRVVFPKQYRDRLESLKNIRLMNARGNLVPLMEVARFDTPVTGLAAVNRQRWKRAITVTADIDEKSKDVTSLSVNKLLMERFADVGERYPGVLLDYRGEFEETQESFENLGRSFFIAIIIIYIILVAIFRSLSHPLIIMGVIPLTLAGVIWAFFFHDAFYRLFLNDTMPLSFLALMGVVGLTGVVVNDSIVMVDFIRKKRIEGLPPVEATITAASGRLRAIFLTTITTFFGLIPTAYGLGGNDPFLKPMAISMSWGLMFGTMITLFATPVSYLILSDFRRLLFRKDKDADKYGVSPDVEIKSLEERIKHDIEAEIKHDLEEELRNEIKRHSSAPGGGGEGPKRGGKRKK